MSDLTFNTKRARFLWEEVEPEDKFQAEGEWYVKYPTSILHGFSDQVEAYEYDTADETDTAWKQVEAYRE